MKKLVLLACTIAGFTAIALGACTAEPAELTEDYIRQAVKPYGNLYVLDKVKEVNLVDGPAEVRMAAVLLKEPRYDGHGTRLQTDNYFFYKRGNQIKWGDMTFFLAIRMVGFDKASGEEE